MKMKMKMKIFSRYTSELLNASKEMSLKSSGIQTHIGNGVNTSKQGNGISTTLSLTTSRASSPMLSMDLSKLSNTSLIMVINSLVEKFGNEAVKVINKNVEDALRPWLFELPTEIVCSLLSQWLSMKDISFLDKSITNQNQRDKLMGLYANSIVVLPGMQKHLWNTDSGYLEYCKWVMNRNAKLASLNVYSSISQFILPDCFSKMDLSKLQWIELSSVQDLFRLNAKSLFLRTIRLMGEVVLSKQDFICILHKFSDLQVLYFEKTICTENSLEVGFGACAFPALCTQLTELSVPDSALLLTGPVLAAVCQSCKNLEVLRIDRCSLLLSVEMMELSKLARLVELDASSTNIDDSVLQQLSLGSVSPLKVLRVNDCAGISSAGLLSLLNHCPSLQRLSCMNNLRVGDDLLLAIPEKSPGLLSLNLSSCPSLTCEGVMHVVQHCPCLEELLLLGFPVAFDAALRAQLYRGGDWLHKWHRRHLQVRLTSKHSDVA
jgi:hypothetical protein